MSFATHPTDTRAPRFPGTSRVLSSLREAIRRGRSERTGRRAAAREIAAYPATRSAAIAVLPAPRHEAA
jgi:hypothetical protein